MKHLNVVKAFLCRDSVALSYHSKFDGVPSIAAEAHLAVLKAFDL